VCKKTIRRATLIPASSPGTTLGTPTSAKITVSTLMVRLFDSIVNGIDEKVDPMKEFEKSRNL
jgi:hypothetical protein